MNYTQIGKTIQWECPNCQWGLATSYFEPIETDDNIYKIYLKKGNVGSLNVIKLVSKVSRTNYITAKSYIEHGDIEICEGKAQEIKLIVSDLEKHKILFKITPEFPY